MAVTPPTTITEKFVDPQTNEVASGKVAFTLTKTDFDDAVIVAGTVETDIQPDGTISIELWPNTAGIALSTYRVTHDRTLLGEIIVPESDEAVDLGDLITVPGIGAIKTIRILTLAQYTALTVKDSSTLYMIRG